MGKKNEAPLRVLLASAEASPFAKTGGLGDVAGTLPFALRDIDVQVSVILPRYASIDAGLVTEAERVAEFKVPTANGPKSCGIDKVTYQGVDVYLVDNNEYFGRTSGLYGYDDDSLRFAFFSRAICEGMVQCEELRCDVVHCNDWQTALVPVYLKELYGHKRACSKVKTVFTIHNAKFQGYGFPDSLSTVADLGDCALAGAACTMDDGSVNLMKGALHYADHLTTVSPTYVHELQTPEYGERLDPVFRRRAAHFSGILNGIDRDVWNPATDEFICRTYSIDNLEGKAECKQALQREMGLPVDSNRPVVGMVTRLTDQKGISMVCQAATRLMDRGVQLVILGSGDPWLEDSLRGLADCYPGQMGLVIGFDNALSHRIYAGSDMLLMPSMFEPCGLSQMIAMRYGTLPVVRETGGLKDSVTPYNKFTGEGTGFSFANANADEMANILLNGCEVFWQDRLAWDQLQQQAMAADFSWKRAAADYLAIYENLVQ